MSALLLPRDHVNSYSGVSKVNIDTYIIDDPTARDNVPPTYRIS